MVAALLMWFWLSAYAICMGAELNSQLELFTTQDTTVDGPAKPGQRGGERERVLALERVVEDERVADVLEEMDPDDAADLIANPPTDDELARVTEPLRQQIARVNSQLLGISQGHDHLIIGKSRELSFRSQGYL